MYELTINNQVYTFNFGMGFLRTINQEAVKTSDIKGVSEPVGFRLYLAQLIDGSPEALVHMLDIANRGQNPRITQGQLDAFIDDPDTDIERLTQEVLDFLKRNNATRKQTAAIQEAVAKLQK